MQSRKPQRRGVYAGSFDPLTVGHLWMIEQGVILFDRLVVAIGTNPDKHYTFNLDERLAMLRESVKSFHNVSVTSFSNRYLIDFAQSQSS
jgi:pantetheine-phosphate adenylyltransferase